MSLASDAAKVADTVVDSVLDAVLEEFNDRRENPVYWAAFHSEMVRTLPKWARLRKWHHRRMLRRYRAFIVAKSKYAAVCGRLETE